MALYMATMYGLEILTDQRQERLVVVNLAMIHLLASHIAGITGRINENEL